MATPAKTTSILIPVAIGELIDKITILEIKAVRIAASKKPNVERELKELQQVFAASQLDRSLIAAEWQELHEVNSKLWGIEDGKRLKEASKSFDAEFIALARSVYFENDRRAAIKRRINEKLGSEIVEEKSYASYGTEAPKV